MSAEDKKKKFEKYMVKFRAIRRPTFKQKKEAYLVALEFYGGFVGNSCKAVGVNRSTVHRWRKKDKKFDEMIFDIEEDILDFVESKHMSNINNGDVISIIFHLKTKGKNRGYIERQEVTGKDGGPIESRINIENAKHLMGDLGFERLED